MYWACILGRVFLLQDASPDGAGQLAVQVQPPARQQVPCGRPTLISQPYMKCDKPNLLGSTIKMR